MLSIGLTGGAGSGKSTVARRFAELGVPVCDADRVARDVVAPGRPALEAIRQQFGDMVLTPTGELDRAAMRRRVFADADERRRLEAITHPAIRAELIRWRDAQQAPYAVLEVSILFEAGFDALVDRTLVVDVEPETQRRRLMARDHIDETLAERMLAAQMPRAQRRARADDCILNDGDLTQLYRQVDALHARYLQLAQHAR